MAVDYSNISSIISGFQKILKLQTAGAPTVLPAPILFVGVRRKSGLSPTKIASRIISRKSEAGVPIGALPSGGVSPDEIMERIRIEEIVRGFHEDAIVIVGIPPGTTVSAAGASPAGPVTVFGSTITFTTAYGQIQ